MASKPDVLAGGRGERIKSRTPSKMHFSVLMFSRSLYIDNQYKTAFIVGTLLPCRVAFHGIPGSGARG